MSAARPPEGAKAHLGLSAAAPAVPAHSGTARRADASGDGTSSDPDAVGERGGDTRAARSLVLDTNLVLDLWLFHDPALGALRGALAQGQLRWVATAHMRDELAAVLRYPHLQAVMARRGVDGADVLAAMDAHVHTWAEPATKAPYTCRDRDDQVFIDLAVAHGALLLSKDKAVLKLTRRLARLGVEVCAAPPPLPLRAE